MTETLPTQEQVDRVARDLAPDVVRIRVMEREDWAGDMALYFRVTLSDDASHTDRLGEVAQLVRAKLTEELRLDDMDHHPYVRFRSESEQAKLQDPLWA